MYDYFLFASFGNDSIALIQWAFEKNLRNVCVVHSDTGWASPDWPARVEKAETWVTALGFAFKVLPSKGMAQLIKDRMAWPMNGAQFCTLELKIIPALAFMDEVDPDKEATCLVGVRREESAGRSQWPEYTSESERHGGRDLWAPLATMLEAERDELLVRAGWERLPHRSRECYPCVNANKDDLKLLDEERVAYIEQLEAEMGFTKLGKPRTMFRPKKKMGAVGIREVVRWAQSPRGRYLPLADEPDVGSGSGCDSGYCAT